MIIGISINLWSAGGRLCCHSTEEGRNKENITGRAAVKASQIMITKPRTATRETNEPMEETTFHVV